MFKKKPLTIPEQLAQLNNRGLIIHDIEAATHALSHISYYRLAGYWWSMQADKDAHLFKPNSKFSDVISLYHFDRDLRILLFDVIEKIEISLRTKLVYHLSHEYDPWWFQNSSLFTNVRELIKTLENMSVEIERSKDVFIRSHLKKHKDDLRFPPAWKTLELTSFGGLSKLYGNLKPTIQSKDIIAMEFGTINHTFLPSWLQSITQIRNYCAHHSRLWNKKLPGKPKLMPTPPYQWINDVPTQPEFHKLYIHLCCMKYLLNVVQPCNHFTHDLISLFSKYTNVDPCALGMKPDWLDEPLWML